MKQIHNFSRQIKVVNSKVRRRNRCIFTNFILFFIIAASPGMSRPMSAMGGGGIYNNPTSLIDSPDGGPVSGTENPLWIDQKYKAYEEQELTMMVFSDQVCKIISTIFSSNQSCQQQSSTKPLHFHEFCYCIVHNLRNFSRQITVVNSKLVRNRCIFTNFNLIFCRKTVS